MKALCLIREAPTYRRDASLNGLKAAGFQIMPHGHKPTPGDLLVIWNRYAHYEAEALRFEAAGAAVIVMENGYLGHHEDEYRKSFAVNGEQLYAMALWHHNGAGRWPVGAPGRWREQGITVQPWRKNGEHILVLPQRGFGPAGRHDAEGLAAGNRQAAQDAYEARGAAPGASRQRTHCAALVARSGRMLVRGDLGQRRGTEGDLRWCAGVQ